MTPLCSVLIPSRARLDKLVRCVDSFIIAEFDRSDYEILIRVDDDDPLLELYQAWHIGASSINQNIKLFIGPRVGFKRMNEYLTELSVASKAHWNLHFNDDATIEGPWLSQLEQVPMERHFAVCEWHKLGGSAYQYDFGGPFPFLPREFWKLYGGDGVPPCADKDSIHNLMEIGFNPWFLKDVSFHHQRDDNETLEAHRK